MRRSTHPTMQEVGEFGFIDSILPKLGKRRDVLVGPGHDCAVVRSPGRAWLVTVDSLVEGVHFKRHWLSPRQLGRKSFLINASDIAAMGGQPRFCLVNFGVPPTYRSADLVRVQAGIVSAADELGAAVVGGNLSQATQLSITITLLGEAPSRLCTRAGAQPGDQIFLTGTIGAAALAVHQWLRGGTPSGAAVRRFREPEPRVRAGKALVESRLISSMIDVSDGLVQDLGHVCKASGVGAHVELERIPIAPVCRKLPNSATRLALSGGEDYELLCTVPAHNLTRLKHLQAALGCPIHRIGEITHGRGVKVVDATGKRLRFDHGGFDHFASRR
ncbi:MAG: thiamine-phosphate kinase [Deltaproteobacteria bacterium]|nr:thiamine-phosphate kinase [Deltaproteobacteria bacterium]